MLRISWLFCIFRYSPANKVWNPKRGKFPNKDMAKIQNISEIHPTLGFTEFDIIEKYRKSFHESELVGCFFPDTFHLSVCIISVVGGRY